jgi:hypothetical protein
LQLRKDFQPDSLARLTPSRGRWKEFAGLLVSIIAISGSIVPDYAIVRGIGQLEAKMMLGILN